MKKGAFHMNRWLCVLGWCSLFYTLLFPIWSIVDIMGWDVNKIVIVCACGIVSLIVVVTFIIIKRLRDATELKEDFANRSTAIREAVSEILSFGGICSQTDAVGWEEFIFEDWAYIKCYVKNVDDCKTLVICPIESAIRVEQVVTICRIVTEQKVGVLNAEVVIAPDLRGYIELCLDMPDIIFAQPYYHRIFLSVASIYIPVVNFLKGREYIDNNADTTTDSENMEDVVFRKEDILY